MFQRNSLESADRHTLQKYSALDLAGLLFNISLTMCEILEGTCSCEKLASRYEGGKLALESDLIIHAAAVYDHIYRTMRPEFLTTQQ